MTQRQSFAVLVVHAVVALAILAAATYLCAAGKLDASAVVGLFGTAIALVGVSGQQLSQQIVNGGPKPNLDKWAASSPEELGRYMQGQGSGHGPHAPAAAPSSSEVQGA